MCTISKTYILNLLLFLFISIHLCNNLSIAGDAYDGYYNYIGTYPNEKDTVYAEDIQGIAHNDDYWFITKSGDEGNRLYKIHVSQDLSNPFISSSTTPASSGLTLHGYSKFKAMDSRKNPTNGIWYIFIGVEGSSGAGIAVYDENLNFKGVSNMPDQSAAGWCALDNSGKVYSGVNDTSHLNCYDFDWEALALSGSVPSKLEPANKINLQDSKGNALTMSSYQGGDFTPEGDKLFIVTGFFDLSTSPHGIHVFDASSSANVFRRIRKSSQSGLFRYNYDPDCSFGDYSCEEPEGLTFWDLTDSRAPHIGGELHVLLLDNDADTIVVDDDDIYIKHYTKSIYVDSNATGLPFYTGDPGFPFKTVTDAVNLAFDDMEIRIKGGTYPENISIPIRNEIAKKIKNFDPNLVKKVYDKEKLNQRRDSYHGSIFNRRRSSTIQAYASQGQKKTRSR